MNVPLPTLKRNIRLARALEDHPGVAEQVDRGEISPMEGRRRAGKDPEKSQGQYTHSPDPKTGEPKAAPGFVGDRDEDFAIPSSQIANLPKDEDFNLTREEDALHKFAQRRLWYGRLRIDKLKEAARSPEEAREAREAVDRIVNLCTEISKALQTREKELEPAKLRSV